MEIEKLEKMLENVDYFADAFGKLKGYDVFGRQLSYQAPTHMRLVSPRKDYGIVIDVHTPQAQGALLHYGTGNLFMIASKEKKKD